MKSFATLALALAGVAVANPVPSGVTSAIAPSGTAPAGCSTSYASTFEISTVKIGSSKRGLEERKALTITLADGVLTDDEGRIGYIASNNQFQFDEPPQAGAIYTAGWSVCSNGTLALGSSAIFYQCLSGDFYNLYDESTGDQCSPIYIEIVTTGGVDAVSTAAESTTASSAVSQISDGQIQATSAAAAVSQISDGQIQASSAVVKTTSAAVVSQISDGQIQATSAVAKTTSAAVVSQISDGQIQATSAGYTTASASKNSTTVAAASPSISTFTGGAALPTMATGFFGVVAGAIAVIVL